MLLFIVYGTTRLSLEVPDSETVGKLKATVRNRLFYGKKEDPNEVLEVVYAGAYLLPEWILGDIGVQPGATVHVTFRLQKKPTLVIESAYNDHVYKMTDFIDVIEETVADLRALVCRVVGLPITVFRLIYKGSEMYDCNKIIQYNLTPGDTVQMEIWDGWGKYLIACQKGATNTVLSLLMKDEAVAKFQLKVALHIASHFGHVDLASTLLSMGLRADEPVGDHPARIWCNSIQPHPDSLQAAIHEAAENGHLSILRTFIHHNICFVLAENGRQLKALNIVLRKKFKPCTRFLLTKQWTKIQYSTTSMPLKVYNGIHKWADRAKERTSYLYGPEKSTYKRKGSKSHKNALVGTDVSIDGFGDSRMQSRQNDLTAEERLPRRKQNAENLTVRKYFEKATENIKVDESTTNSESSTTASPLRLPPLAVARRPETGALAPLAEEDEELDEELLPGSPTRRRRSVAKKSDKLIGRTIAPPNLSQLPVRRESIWIPPSVIADDDRRSSSASQQPLVAKQAVTPKKRRAKSQPPRSSNQASSESNSRPYWVRDDNDPAIRALLCYEKRRGCSAKDYAIDTLAMTNRFTKKSWLQQVHIAMRLTEGRVKRSTSFVV